MNSETHSVVSCISSPSLVFLDEDQTSSPPSSDDESWPWSVNAYNLFGDDEESDSASDSKYSWGYPSWGSFSYWPCCSPSWAEDNFAMACEGTDEQLWIFEPFRDFRSVAREKHRSRKIRENKRGCNSYKCRKQEQARQRTINTKNKREKLRVAIQESQKDVPCHTRDLLKRTKHTFVQWDTELPEDNEDWVAPRDEETIHYTILHDDAPTTENPEPYSQFGEKFTTWCQRRMEEMRSVEKSRIHRNPPMSIKPTIWKRKMDWKHVRQYDIYTGDEGSTTLPTNAYDALGPTRLCAILTPNKHWLKQCSGAGTPPFPIINGYVWFGEYVWGWRRNMSGCWEIKCDGKWWESDAEWQVAPAPCLCSSASSDGMGFGCSCSEEAPAPEEEQRCSLVEWVGRKGRDIMLLEDAVREAGARGSGVDVESETGETESDAAWEFVSSASSETWSIVDGER